MVVHGPVTAVACGGRGGRLVLVASGATGSLTAFDAVTGTQLSPPGAPDTSLLSAAIPTHPTLLQGHGSSVRGAALTADGRIGLTVGVDGVLALWDIAANARLYRLPHAHRDDTVQPTDVAVVPLLERVCPLSACALAADGALAVTGDTSGAVVFWRMPWLAPTQPQTPHTLRVAALALTPDAARCVSISDDGSVAFWRAARLAPGRDGNYDVERRGSSTSYTRPAHDTSNPPSATTPDADMQGTTRSEGLLAWVLHSVPSAEEEENVTRQRSPGCGSSLSDVAPPPVIQPTSCALAMGHAAATAAGATGGGCARSAGGVVAIGTATGRVVLLAAVDGHFLRQWLAHGPRRSHQSTSNAASGTTAVALGGEGGAAWVLTAGGRDGHVIQWRSDCGEQLRSMPTGAAVTALGYVPALDAAVAALADGRVLPVHLATCTARPRGLDARPPCSVCLSGDGRRLLGVSLTSAQEARQASVALYALTHVAPPRLLPLPPKTIILSPPPVSLDHTGAVAVIAVGTRLLIWNVVEGASLATPTVSALSSRRVSSEMSPLASGTLQPLPRVVETEHWLTTLRLSADASLACTGTASGPLVLWDVQRRTEALVLYHHAACIIGADMVANGQLAVSLDAVGDSLAVWSTSRAQLVHTLVHGIAPACSLALAPHGHLTSLGHVDGAVTLWLPRQGTLLRTLCPGSVDPKRRFSSSGMPAPGLTLTLALSTNGRYVLVGDGATATLRVYCTATAALLSNTPAHGGVLVAADLVRVPTRATRRHSARAAAAEAACTAAAEAAVKAVSRHTSAAATPRGSITDLPMLVPEGMPYPGLGFARSARASFARPGELSLAMVSARCSFASAASPRASLSSIARPRSRPHSTRSSLAALGAFDDEHNSTDSSTASEDDEEEHDTEADKHGASLRDAVAGGCTRGPCPAAVLVAIADMSGLYVRRERLARVRRTAGSPRKATAPTSAAPVCISKDDVRVNKNIAGDQQSDGNTRLHEQDAAAFLGVVRAASPVPTGSPLLKSGSAGVLLEARSRATTVAVPPGAIVSLL